MNLPASLFSNTIKEKEIFYFSSEQINTDEPHYFICIKKSANEVLIFTCCTTQGAKRESYIIKKGYPISTLVYIKPGASLPFKEETFVDCNRCMTYTMDEFIKLCNEGKMNYKGEISDIHYEQILIGLQDSPEIDAATKKILPNPDKIE